MGKVNLEIVSQQNSVRIISLATFECFEDNLMRNSSYVGVILNVKCFHLSPIFHEWRNLILI